MTPLLVATAIGHAYQRRPVLHDVSLTVTAGERVAILGPNGSGKSTFLRIVGRLLRPAHGKVHLEGTDLALINSRLFAQRLAFVPQGPIAPADLVVEELVRRGRYPHRGPYGRANPHDADAIDRALASTGLEALRHRAMGTLSGGERQRAWIALALAQEPRILLLDEPTTFLDIAHQIELLALLDRLNRDAGLTVVTVLHDVAQAAQFAGRLVGFRDGRLVADGPPAAVVTPDGLRAIFGVELRVFPDPATGAPIVAAALPEQPPAAAPAPRKPGPRKRPAP